MEDLVFELVVDCRRLGQRGLVACYLTCDRWRRKLVEKGFTHHLVSMAILCVRLGEGHENSSSTELAREVSRRLSLLDSPAPVPPHGWADSVRRFVERNQHADVPEGEDGWLSLAAREPGGSYVRMCADGLRFLLTGGGGAYLEGRAGEGSLGVYRGVGTADAGHRVTSVAMAGGEVASAGFCEEGSVRMWDAELGAPVLKRRAAVREKDVQAIGVSGECLAVAGEGGEIELCGGDGGGRVLSGHEGSVYALEFFPGGRRLCSGGRDGTVRVWDLETGRMELKVEVGQMVFDVSVSPDGSLVASANWDASVQLWRASDGELARTLRGHHANMRCVAFSPDGTMLASGAMDRQLKVWEVRSGRELFSATGHAGALESLAWRPDGRVLFSAGADGCVVVWEVARGQPPRLRETLRGHAAKVCQVCCSADGATLVTGSLDGTVRVWDVRERGAAAQAPGGGGGRELCAVS